MCMEVTPEHNGGLSCLFVSFVCLLLFCCIIQEHTTSPDTVLILLPVLGLRAWSTGLDGYSVWFFKDNQREGLGLILYFTSYFNLAR